MGEMSEPTILDQGVDPLETPESRIEEEPDWAASGESEASEEDEEDEDDDDEDDDDDNEGDGNISKTAVKKKFDKFIADLKTGDLSLENQADLKKFMSQHQSILTRTSNPKNQTLLHLLVDAGKEDLPIRKIKGLVRALVQLPDNLLAQLDVDDKTPLFCAISMRNHRLARAMCDAHEDIDSVLGIQTKRTSNCLHQAIQRKESSKDDDFIDFLIGRCGQQTLCAADENGLTPLHLAVDYKRCDDAQPRIVRALVEKCGTTMDQIYEHPEEGPLSPYRYHEHTCQKALERENMDNHAKEARKKVEKQLSEPSVNGTAIDSRNGSNIGRPANRDRPKPHNGTSDSMSPYPNPSVRRLPVHVDAPTGKFGSGPAKAGLADTPKLRPLIRVTTLEMSARNEGVHTPAPLRKPLTKKRTRNSKVKPTEHSAQTIRRFLKLQYLRTKNHGEALEFFYGVNQDREICFDLFECGADGATISQSYITDGINKHVHFEDVLQYVAFPQIQIEANYAIQKAGKAPSQKKPDGRGRTDLQPLFQWLREDKKVDIILKVIVEDLQEPSHSDEAIENCLKGMGVEIWEWKKTDLSSDVIYKVAPDAREVHLYWSGSNAVLRGWGEEFGLRQLKKLEKVHLYVQQGLDTYARTLKYVKEFKDRIESNSSIKVIHTKVKDDMADNATGGNDAAHERNDRQDRWISTMLGFAEFLQNAERNAEPRLHLPHPVLVAVIDDGVDIKNTSIQSKIIGGRSFCYRDEEQNLNQPYYISSSRHGTAMVDFICKICPNARLYIIKLNEYAVESGKKQITAKSAARAVRDAVSKKVDIISMSWTIEKNEANKSHIAELEKAIELAASKNILMFCAATDQGAYKDLTYPAASGTKRIFKIGAAEASGAAPKWLGDHSAVDFIFPGDQVVIDQSVEKYGPLTGSSVATALASGLAAVILYCVQLGSLYTAIDKHKDVDHASYLALRNHGRMKNAFLQIGTTKESENKFITVWNRFSKTTKKAENEPRDVWIELVAELALDLTRDLD